MSNGIQEFCDCLIAVLIFDPSVTPGLTDEFPSLRLSPSWMILSHSAGVNPSSQVAKSDSSYVGWGNIG